MTRLAFLAAPLLLLFCGIEERVIAQKQESLDVVQSRDRVLAAFDENYSKLETMRGVLIFRRTMTDEVKELISDASSKQSNGGLSIKSLEEQLAEKRLNFLIKGTKLRFDGTTLSPDNVVVIDGRRIEVLSRKKYRSVRDYNIPLTEARDPREIFFDDSLRLHDVLKDMQWSESYTAGPKEESLVIVCKSAAFTKIEIQFDAAQGLLPVRTLETTGTPPAQTVVSSEVEYQQIGGAGKGAWVMKSLALKRWPRFHPANVLSDFSTQWSALHTFTVQDLTVNEPIANDQFVIAPANGTRGN